MMVMSRVYSSHKSPKYAKSCESPHLSYGDLTLWQYCHASKLTPSLTACTGELRDGPIPEVEGATGAAQYLSLVA